MVCITKFLQQWIAKALQYNFDIIITHYARDTMIKSIKAVLVYTAIVLFVSIVYFVYAYTTYPPTPERETFLSEIGEDFGEVGLWA